MRVAMRVTKMFPKGELLEVIEEDIGEGVDGYIALVNEIIETTRWSILYDVVFSHGGKTWRTNYYRGATELQDEQPWENDGDEIVCTEVYPSEKTVTIYKYVEKE